jgi:hypothetical protein
MDGMDKCTIWYRFKLRRGMLAVGNWGSSAWARERPLFLRVEKRGCLFSLPVCILEGNTGIYMAAGRKETNGSREVNNNAGSYAGTPFHSARETRLISGTTRRVGGCVIVLVLQRWDWMCLLILGYGKRTIHSCAECGVARGLLVGCLIVPFLAERLVWRLCDSVRGVFVLEGSEKG